MKFFGNLVVFMGVCVAVSNAFNCERSPNWYRVPNSRKCIRVVEGVVGPLSSADEHCGSLHGSRALTIKSEEEQQFVNNLLFRELQMEDDVWLGGQRQNLKFMWRNEGELIDGQVYSNWAPNRPTRNFPKACLLLQSNNTANPGKWVDQYCFSVAAIVCENFHVDVLPDKPDNDNDNNTDVDNGDSCRNCVSEERLNRQLDELREEFEQRMNDLGQKIGSQSAVIGQLLSTLNDRYQNYDRLIGLNKHNIAEILERMHYFDQIDLAQIGRNFTGVAHVLTHFRVQIENVIEKVAELSSRPPSGGNSNDDLNDLRDELKDFVKNLVSEGADGVTDARLNYVNYRRALQIEKGGRWVTLGYV